MKKYIRLKNNKNSDRIYIKDLRIQKCSIGIVLKKNKK